MDERLHASLDGDLPSNELTPEERAALDAFAARLTELRASLASRAPRAIDTVVMARIHAIEPTTVSSALQRSG
jgi:hypothetical protein